MKIVQKIVHSKYYALGTGAPKPSIHQVIVPPGVYVPVVNLQNESFQSNVPPLPPPKEPTPPVHLIALPEQVPAFPPFIIFVTFAIIIPPSSIISLVSGGIIGITIGA